MEVDRHDKITGYGKIYKTNRIMYGHFGGLKQGAETRKHRKNFSEDNRRRSEIRTKDPRKESGRQAWIVRIKQHPGQDRALGHRVRELQKKSPY
jgi:hypothetical protein